MKTAKIFLNICIGISLVICSICLLIFSSRNAPANAQTTMPDGYQPVGVIHILNRDYAVIGYNFKTGETKTIAQGQIEYKRQARLRAEQEGRGLHKM